MSEFVLSMSIVVQAEAPPVGLVEMSALPPLSTATQRPAIGQATAVNPLASVSVVTVHTGALAVGVGELRGLDELFGAGVRVAPPDVEPHPTATTPASTSRGVRRFTTRAAQP